MLQTLPRDQEHSLDIDTNLFIETLQTRLLKGDVC